MQKKTTKKVNTKKISTKPLNNYYAIGKEALALHKKLKGKIAISPKSKITPDLLKLTYTPGVAAVSTYLAEHRDNAKITNTYTWRGNTIAVVSDGSAVLGLGNIGPEGALPVMEGKAFLFKSFAGIDAVPIVLQTQNTEEIIATVKAIAPSFAGINLEDISAPRCFEIEARLKSELSIPVMHDDQHGTAMVVLAGLINAAQVVSRKLEKMRVVIAGSGAAGTAVAHLLQGAGIQHIVMVDSKGILHRDDVSLDSSKRALAQITNPEGIRGLLSDALSGADVFIGVSKGNTVTTGMIRSMHQDSIVFALANPIPEIFPEDAYAGGAAVVATGRSDFPNQVNNSLGFPGIFRGALDNGVTDITDKHLIKAAKALAGLVPKPTAKNILPSVFNSKVVPAIARVIKK
jgi:malate dehydrogenase (oxaloacetate-decarboxylating)